MNNSFWVKTYYCEGQNKETTSAYVDYVEGSQLENNPNMLAKDDYS